MKRNAEYNGKNWNEWSKNWLAVGERGNRSDIYLGVSVCLWCLHVYESFNKCVEDIDKQTRHKSVKIFPKKVT